MALVTLVAHVCLGRRHRRVEAMDLRGRVRGRIGVRVRAREP